MSWLQPHTLLHNTVYWSSAGRKPLTSGRKWTPAMLCCFYSSKFMSHWTPVVQGPCDGKTAFSNIGESSKQWKHNFLSIFKIFKHLGEQCLLATFFGGTLNEMEPLYPSVTLCYIVTIWRNFFLPNGLDLNTGFYLLIYFRFFVKGLVMVRVTNLVHWIQKKFPGIVWKQKAGTMSTMDLLASNGRICWHSGYMANASTLIGEERP